MPNRCGMREQQREFIGIPGLLDADGLLLPDARTEIWCSDAETALQAFQIVSELIGDEERTTSHFVYEFGEGVKFEVVEVRGVSRIVEIYRPVGHL